MLGFFAARGLALPDPAIDKLAVCLIIGYAAGVAAGTSLRPRIAITSLLLAVIPPVLTMLATGKTLHIATALMTSAFLAGGIFSLRKRHARALDEIGLRLTFASLARRDGLTELPNRLALREWFERHVRAAKLRPIALHCLDLNGFKPVNDRFGHPVGDALLTAVAKRLSGTLRDGDIAARLGGDEFVIVQLQIGNPDEAYMLAERVAASIARPFAIGSHDVRVTTSIGYIVCEDVTRDLEQLISLADEALYTAKRGGRSICRYREIEGVQNAA
jgi:diguanylate cyclase (GGDEF)-like protein